MNFSRLVQVASKLHLLSARVEYSSAHCLMRCKTRVFTKRTFYLSCSKQSYLDARDPDHEMKQKQLVIHQGEYFEEAAKRKQTFEQAIKLYLKRNGVQRRGHVEFIYAALSRMKEFKVHRDIATYKMLLGIFPEEKMVAKTTWEIEWMHYPKQQQCAIDLLDQMESQGLVPDDEMGYQLIRIFGQPSHVFRKYQRMMYWMPKFKFANPYYVPHDLPADDIELAKMALKRMAVDLENSLSVCMTKDLEESCNNTFIVSAQSPVQSSLIAGHPMDKPVFVEGGFKVWLRSKSLTYFILQSECTHSHHSFHNSTAKGSGEEDLFNWRLFDEVSPPERASPPSVHEQEDGTVLAMCITGTSSKDSLTSWIRFLEKTNPKLSCIPVVFRLRTPEAQLVDVNNREMASHELSSFDEHA